MHPTEYRSLPESGVGECRGNRTTLTADDRAELTRIADRLSTHGSRLVDDASWLDEARDLSCAVPVGTRRLLRRFACDAGPDAMMLLRNLPVDDTLPDTPSDARSVQRESTRPASVLALLAFQLGEPIAYREEKSGALVHDVVPVQGMESFQGNAGSVALTTHIENAFHVHRPDIVGLLCLRNDHDNVAGLQVASVRRAAPLLSGRVRDVLFEPRFVTGAPASFGGVAESAMRHAVLSGDRADPDVKVDFLNTGAVDGEAAQALAALAAAFDEVRRTLVLAPGDLAFLDNRLAVHGRTPFRARYDGRDRWLQRIFLHRDFRRSRPMRPGNGHVLVSTP